MATVGGYVGVFGNTATDPSTNNPVYTADGGGYSDLAGDRALDFGTNQANRLMTCTDIAAALNAATAKDQFTVTFRQRILPKSASGVGPVLDSQRGCSGWEPRLRLPSIHASVD